MESIGRQNNIGEWEWITKVSNIIPGSILYTIFKSHYIASVLLSSQQLIMDSKIFSGNLKLLKYTRTCTYIV